MAKGSSIIVVSLFAFAAAGSACVGDGSQVEDAGNDAAADAAPDAKADAGDASPGACIFGTSHFGDGCKFQP